MLLYGMNEDHSNFDLTRTDLVAVLAVVVCPGWCSSGS